MQTGTQVVMETSRGYLVGTYQGRNRDGNAFQVKAPNGRTYLAGRCIEVPRGTVSEDIPALFVSKTYMFVPCADGRVKVRRVGR